ncbi:unnamed protein product [Mytilus edulis]|uniref:Uncharacterized protein n=1 Tax=Mytilus edulis TaxID=6550 RepID=A0A8S3VGJ3_MYTED|nr:unnamed protein product [Mytilus edulis]
METKEENNSSLSLAVNTTLPKSAGRKPNEKRGWAKKKATCTKPSDLSVIDPFQVDTENNYIFRFLENTRIMVCYGCGKRFRSSTAEVPNPPFDIVLAKKEYRNYVNELGQLKLSLRREFVHYHINTQCILKKDLLFDGQKILVTHNVTTRLSEEHREFIQERLGLQL